MLKPLRWISINFVVFARNWSLKDWRFHLFVEIIKILKTTMSFLLLLTSLAFFPAHAAEAGDACMLFRVHLAADLPTVEHKKQFQSKALPHELQNAIDLWKEKIDFLKNSEERQRWLACVKDFVFLDSNHNGVSDWTAVVDGRPSRVLFPMDEDLDGDGIANVLDPNPYVKNEQSRGGKIPLHLRAKGEAATWQERLQSDFGVLAVNHTDEHVPEVLKTLHGILGLNSIRKWKSRGKFLTLLYAFGSRRAGAEIAAYHPVARAMSLPGHLSYESGVLSDGEKCRLASALLHEIGHAVLLGSLTGDELQAKASQFGGWVLPASHVHDVWNPLLFDHFRGPAGTLITGYAETNVHEWFAESFAAAIWKKEALDSKFCPTFSPRTLPSGFDSWVESLLKR
jgi:hypothetical protein